MERCNGQETKKYEKTLSMTEKKRDLNFVHEGVHKIRKILLPSPSFPHWQISTKLLKFCDPQNK